MLYEEDIDHCCIDAGGISNYWKAENMGAVTAKIDEQKTEVIMQEVIELDKKL